MGSAPSWAAATGIPWVHILYVASAQTSDVAVASTSDVVAVGMPALYSRDHGGVTNGASIILLFQGR